MAAPGPREARGAPMGQFDFHVLALSWSPGFCENSGSRSPQCDSGSGLGFVTHGLWPQYEQGYPSFCEPSGRFVPQAAMADAKGLFPDDNLARYQWRKHGTCTGESPSGYFQAVRRARELVRIPDGFKGLDSRSQVLPSEIERAFIDVNPGLRPDMIAVSCGRRILQEVRICLTRDLRGFRSCPEVDRDGCRAGAITVPAPR
ncbi:ribonuclease T [Microvirga sp. SYSU G3D207]|uniref:Ribonuclease T n=2 Tax=Microvirga arsenatis TaxID=2692265 RepID=A0ABW9Z7Q4_9HYPH|nr:ribonuclease T [Microvirga arsenatis]NBJ26931.1 ribonuclease T [Microvirga arsenatis]